MQLLDEVQTGTVATSSLPPRETGAISFHLHYIHMKDFHLWQAPQVSLVYHNPTPPQERTKITSSRDADNVFRAHWGDQLEVCEEFYVLLLNSSSEALGILHLSKGGIYSTDVDVRLLFAATITALATGIILAHNHPSGNIRPSQGDIACTENIQHIADLFQIKLFDHLILSAHEYFSFSDEGMIYPYEKRTTQTPC